MATLGGAIACSSHAHPSGGAGGTAGTGGAGGAGGKAATGGAAGAGGCLSESTFFCVSYLPDAGCPTGEVCSATDCPTGCHPESV